MINRLRQSIAASGAALLAAVLAGSMPAIADAPDQNAGEQSRPHIEDMRARMQAMHALMIEIRQTGDLAVRQKLMGKQLQLMRDQMADMDAMGDGLMGRRSMRHGMEDCGASGGGMMEPSTTAPAG